MQLIIHQQFATKRFHLHVNNTAPLSWCEWSTPTGDPPPATSLAFGAVFCPFLPVKGGIWLHNDVVSIRLKLSVAGSQGWPWFPAASNLETIHPSDRACHICEHHSGARRGRPDCCSCAFPSQDCVSSFHARLFPPGMAMAPSRVWYCAGLVDRSGIGLVLAMDCQLVLEF